MRSADVNPFLAVSDERTTMPTRFYAAFDGRREAATNALVASLGRQVLTRFNPGVDMSLQRDLISAELTGIATLLLTKPLLTAARIIRAEYLDDIDTKRLEYDRVKAIAFTPLSSARFWNAVVQLALWPKNMFATGTRARGRVAARVAQNELFAQSGSSMDFYTWAREYRELKWIAENRPSLFVAKSAMRGDVNVTNFPTIAILIPMYLEYLNGAHLAIKRAMEVPAYDMNNSRAISTYKKTLRESVNAIQMNHPNTADLAGEGGSLRGVPRVFIDDTIKEGIHWTKVIASALLRDPPARIRALPLPNELFYVLLGEVTTDFRVNLASVTLSSPQFRALAPLLSSCTTLQFSCDDPDQRALSQMEAHQMPPNVATYTLNGVAFPRVMFAVNGTTDHGRYYARVTQGGSRQGPKVTSLRLVNLYEWDTGSLSPMSGQRVQYIISACAPSCQVLYLSHVELPGPRVWLQRSNNVLTPYTLNADPLGATKVPMGARYTQRSISAEVRYYWTQPMLPLVAAAAAAAAVSTDDEDDDIVGDEASSTLRTLVINNCLKPGWATKRRNVTQTGRIVHPYASGRDLERFFTTHARVFQWSVTRLTLKGQHMFAGSSRAAATLSSGAMAPFTSLEMLRLKALTNLRFLRPKGSLQAMIKIVIEDCHNLEGIKDGYDEFTAAVLVEARRREAAYTDAVSKVQLYNEEVSRYNMNLAPGAVGDPLELMPERPSSIQLSSFMRKEDSLVTILTGKESWKTAVKMAIQWDAARVLRDAKIEKRRIETQQNARDIILGERKKRTAMRKKADIEREKLRPQFPPFLQAILEGVDGTRNWPTHYTWVPRVVYWQTPCRVKEVLTLFLDWVGSTLTNPSTRTRLMVENASDDAITVQTADNAGSHTYRATFDSSDMADISGFTWTRPARLVRPTYNVDDVTLKRTGNAPVFAMMTDMRVTLEGDRTRLDGNTGTVYRTEAGLGDNVRVEAGTFQTAAPGMMSTFTLTMEQALCVTGAQCISALVILPPSALKELEAQREMKARKREEFKKRIAAARATGKSVPTAEIEAALKRARAEYYTPWEWELPVDQSQDASYLQPLRAFLWSLIVDLKGAPENAEYVASMDNFMAAYFTARLSMAHFMHTYGDQVDELTREAYMILVNWLDKPSDGAPSLRAACTTYALYHSQTPIPASLYMDPPQQDGLSNAYIVPQSTIVVPRLSTALFDAGTLGKKFKVTRRMGLEPGRASSSMAAQVVKTLFGPSLRGEADAGSNIVTKIRRGEGLVQALPELDQEGGAYNLAPVFGAIQDAFDDSAELDLTEDTAEDQVEDGAMSFNGGRRAPPAAPKRVALAVSDRTSERGPKRTKNMSSVYELPRLDAFPLEDTSGEEDFVLRADVYVAYLDVVRTSLNQAQSQTDLSSDVSIAESASEDTGSADALDAMNRQAQGITDDAYSLLRIGGGVEASPSVTRAATELQRAIGRITETIREIQFAVASK